METARALRPACDTTMRQRLIYALILLAALAAAVGMPWLGWDEAQRQAYEAEAELAMNHARDVLHRANQTSRQAREGMRRLAASQLPPCSEASLELMRRIDLTSTNLQAIGHVENGVLVCSSQGPSPTPLGPMALRTSTGYDFYLDVPMPDATNAVMAIARGRWAVLIHRDLPLDIGAAANGVSLAVVHLERLHGRGPMIARGQIDLRWVRRLGERRNLTFIDGDHLVAIARSSEFRIASVAAVPLERLDQRVTTVARRLVPAGMVLGVVLAAAILLLARERMSIAAALRLALRRGEFFMLYQPLVDADSGRWVGVEALLRWRRATGELIGPDLFIPVAEENSMMPQLTRRVLQLVEADAGAFLARHPGFHVAVNLSPADLRGGAIVAQLDGFLARSGAAPSNLIVEITERGFLDMDSARDTIAALRRRGIEVAIDDFGTGYSSLACLESLDLDFIKIDRSFIETVGTRAPTSQVVGHIISIANTLGLRMIAEGVERPQQAAFLREHGVHFAQGWLYGEPMPFAEVTARLAEQDGSGASGARH